jgi:cell wall-associated NlpC family hydrolase
VRRTALSLLAAALACAAVTVVALAAGSGEQPVRAAARVLKAPSATPPDTLEVASPTRAVLAEMDRRLGTPRRVLIAARRRARLIARIERRLARLRAAQRAEAERRLAALRAAQLAQAPWFDAAAAQALTRQPDSPAEQQWIASGRGGWVEASGYARPPANAPAAIKRVMQAGNMIARSPYVWGGGHGAWRDHGYDCSGSVSYALAAGGMLGYSQTSGQLMDWGAPGPGRWLTVYANHGHVFMTVAGLRFDTSGRAGDHSSRWQLSPRSADGFAARHYPGL